MYREPALTLQDDNTRIHAQSGICRTGPDWSNSQDGMLWIFEFLPKGNTTMNICNNLGD